MIQSSTKKPSLNSLDLAQSDRFIETARELGAEDDAGALDWVLGKVVPPVGPLPKKEGGG